MNPSTVLITGACGDLGRSLGRVFAAKGARLALCDLKSEADARPEVTELQDLGAEVCYAPVDVTDAAAMAQFVATIGRQFGPPDVCVVNAGVVERAPLVELSLEAWRRTLDVNLTGSFITAQAAARAMIAAGRAGQIIFISSWVEDVPRENIGAYCASKGGVRMLARTLALELASRHIRVNSVAPGWVDAGLTGRNLAGHPERRAEIEARIPLGRLASADEIARTVRMLASEDASYLTGVSLVVDGGSGLGHRR